MQVLLASLPFFFDEDEADEWLSVFEKASLKCRLLHVAETELPVVPRSSDTSSCPW